MSNNKRKRAVVLALIAFFCGATAFVSVDWKRFGGGFLALFKHNSEPMPAYASGSAPSGGGTLGSATDSHGGAAPLPQLVALGARRHANSVGGGSGSHKPDEDLFKYGDPAAGGIPAGSFLVAQNDTAGSGTGGAGVPAPVGGSAAPETAVNAGTGDAGDSGGSGVTAPAPAPAGTGGAGDGGTLFPTPTPSPSPAPTPATPPVTPPPVVSPPTPPAPTPTQSGTNDQNPGNGGGDLPPVSAVPEASDAAMMGLGALFLAVAATRRRKNDPA